MPPVRHIVYECIPGSFAGGVQKMVFELASAQRRLGADVEVWTPDAIRAGSTEVFSGLPIHYFMPDHRSLLQQFVMQQYDVAPSFPELDRFLAFWRREIDAVLHSVRVAHKHLIGPQEWRAVDGIITIN